MKSSSKLIASFLVIILIQACAEKKKEEKENFWHVLSFIGGQVAEMDSSLQTIRKYVYVDSTRIDTEFVHRDRFREVAAEFLSLPDLAKPEYMDRYKENTNYDKDLNRLMITYTPVNPNKEKIQKEEILVKPDPSGDKITSIYIITLVDTRDSIVEKKMFWKVDESFQITTTRQLPSQPEKISTYKVAWNEEN